LIGEVQVFIALYFDEDVEIEIPLRLAGRGWDVSWARQAGALHRSDQEQITLAISQRRAIVTHNRHDFEQLHSDYLSTGRTHYGIVVARFRFNLGDTVNRLLVLLDSFTADEMANQLRYV
jgi:Domain of unknown function (DUF5615)